MKNFFIAFLGSLAGIWFSLMLLFFGSIIVISCAIAFSGGSSDPTVKLSDNSVLRLDLNCIITDREQSVDIFAQLQGDQTPSQALNKVVGAIDKAASDKKSAAYSSTAPASPPASLSSRPFSKLSAASVKKPPTSGFTLTLTLTDRAITISRRRPTAYS